MRTVKCPTCGKPSSFEPSNPFRPFCSERCQTLDLGAWASEKFRVPAEEPAESVNQNSDQLAAEDQDQDLESRRH